MKAKITKTVLFFTLLITILSIHPMPTHAGSWEYAEPGSRLRLNPMSGRWEYAKPNARLRLNPMSGTWQYSEQNDVLKFNPMSKPSCGRPNLPVGRQDRLQFDMFRTWGVDGQE